ncbi:uncharacterized protein LOC131226105 isoform X2 [Magnolia sinica]|uniref:uncharacterized protein LOC131226105 isoform X2 n=1 Tax=Magnolia sinica TaxID=86752 RepID=UPI00265A6DA6|nr:uncharacterized protein LOC131226105 isoform X2 [Magnolia sinica]
MALHSSFRPPFSPLTPSHKSLTIPRNPIAVPKIPEIPFRGVSAISILASPIPRCHVIRSPCSCGESSDFRLHDDEESHSNRIFIKVKIITERFSKLSLGFAYVWFTCEEDAELAVKEMDGKFVDGRFISVTIANPESPSSRVRATPYKF